MANEILAQGVLVVTNTVDNKPIKVLNADTGRLFFNQTGLGGGNPGKVDLVADVDTAVPFTGIGSGTQGWAMIFNLKPFVAGRYVQWGPDSGGALVPTGRIIGGSFAGPFQFDAAVALRMKSVGEAGTVVLLVAEV